jgi:hypothetical protein
MRRRNVSFDTITQHVPVFIREVTPSAKAAKAAKGRVDVGRRDRWSDDNVARAKVRRRSPYGGT